MIFCGFRSVAVNSVYNNHRWHFLAICRSEYLSFPIDKLNRSQQLITVLSAVIYTVDRLFIYLLRQEDSIKNTQVCKHIGLSINIAHSIEEQFSDRKRVQVVNS